MMVSFYAFFKFFLALQAFVLNFNGRVIQPSVKNFQLVDTYDGKK
jgi:hypothetical protein